MKPARQRLFVTLAATPLAAQGWPAKPIGAAVPVGAGSTTDIVPRGVVEPATSSRSSAA
jgi:tripartite-type tricarboxylate transporter receptor subunit TctC